MYYLVEVTYSSDLVDETTQVTVTFQYTPLPIRLILVSLNFIQNGFYITSLMAKDS